MDYETYAPLASWFEATWMGEQMRNIFWLFPAMETVHFIGLTIMFGSLLVIDVRVIGFGRFINMRAALKFIPVAIAAFTVNLLSGIAFLCADPFRYFPNIAFQWKMGLIVIAGLNALWFWFGNTRVTAAGRWRGCRIQSESDRRIINCYMGRGDCFWSYDPLR